MPGTSTARQATSSDTVRHHEAHYAILAEFVHTALLYEADLRIRQVCGYSVSVFFVDVLAMQRDMIYFYTGSVARPANPRRLFITRAITPFALNRVGGDPQSAFRISPAVIKIDLTKTIALRAFYMLNVAIPIAARTWAVLTKLNLRPLCWFPVQVKAGYFITTFYFQCILAPKAAQQHAINSHQNTAIRCKHMATKVHWGSAIRADITALHDLFNETLNTHDTLTK